MSTDKADPSKKDATISSADDLTNTSKGDVELSEEELKRVTGGKLVAVKTISWAHDDEAPKETTT
jgi:hypothetical protein